MVMFKTWKDNYIFLRDYASASCLNCAYGGTQYTDDSETHTDTEYAHLFCRESICMVRLDLMTLCAKWRHQDTGLVIEDIEEENMWKLSDKVIDALDEDDKRWSIEEVRELIANEETIE